MGEVEDSLKEQGFVTPPEHFGFLAKKLYAGGGEITDAAVAYLAPAGGGPTTLHTHPHDHLFIVVSGAVKIIEGDREVVLHDNQSLLVKGTVSHKTLNVSDGTSIMIGITIKR